MPNTMTLIDSYTVGAGGTATVTFSSIPSTYTDLVFKVSARSDNASTKTNLRIKFNTSDANFAATMVGVSDNSTLSQTEGSTYANTVNYSVNANNSTASVFNNHETYITNYSSSGNKNFSSDNVMEINSSSNQMALFGSNWANSSAINQIDFYLISGNFSQYSTFYLYGIKNS